MSVFGEFYRRTAIVDRDLSVAGKELVGLWPKEYPEAPLLDLPLGETGPPVSLWEILRRRRSRRDWISEEVRLGEFSALLHHAAGVTGHVSTYGYSEYPLRAFPSAGGLQSTEVYVTFGPRAVQGLDGGVFHYRPVGHKLERLGESTDGAEIYRSLLIRQPWLSKTEPVVVVLTVAYGRLARKYGHAAGRLAAMEVGWVGQNIYLVAEALGLSVCAINGADDRTVANVLGISIDEDEEYPMLVMGVGLGRTRKRTTEHELGGNEGRVSRPAADPTPGPSPEPRSGSSDPSTRTPSAETPDRARRSSDPPPATESPPGTDGCSCSSSGLIPRSGVSTKSGQLQPTIREARRVRNARGSLSSA